VIKRFQFLFESVYSDFDNIFGIVVELVLPRSSLKVSYVSKSQQKTGNAGYDKPPKQQT